LAIDHTHCFGTRNGELTERVKHLDIIREEAVFGLFPEFAPLLNREIVVQSLQDLATIKDSVVRTALGGIPREWNVTPKAKAALSELIIRRAAFVAQSLEAKLFAQQRIEFTDQNGN
jgi:hypothetical protein